MRGSGEADKRDNFFYRGMKIMIRPLPLLVPTAGLARAELFSAPHRHPEVRLSPHFTGKENEAQGEEGTCLRGKANTPHAGI